ncbi:MAG TPA: F0F1 ATP synthase subunit epsilon, partial [Actinomycetota bacterium]|nr:F0F1 ATP synthase subunit epsilon [Actinomycetota bacterium]
MQVSVVTPERVLWDEEAQFVLARSADGDIGIL